MAPLRIAVIVASSRPQRVGPAVADWVMGFTSERDGVEYVLVDLAEQDLPNLDEPEPASSGHYIRPHTLAWAEKVAGFDGFLFVTPEYNHSIPGQLKNALDYLYAEWNDKAAAIVSYGSETGIRAVEHLRSVLAELQVATVRATAAISIFDDMTDFTAMAPRDYQPAKVREVMRQLERWAGALRTLR